MEPKSSTKPKPRAGRTWFLRLSLMVCVPTLLLGVAEGILRLAGYGHPSSFFVSSPHHGEGELIENARFAWRFLPPTLARASQPTRIHREKSPGTTRVFVFGESAAEGDPEPAFGMPRLLEVLLEGRFSGRDFEVINASVTAINSHAILPITRECAGLDGDFWVIYIGHNEVMGPFGAGTVFGQKTPPLAALRVGLSLKQFRLGQWIASFGNSSSGAESTQWKGMGMFLDQQLRATDPQLNWVYDSYKKNLSDVLAESRLAGVRVVLSTAASNLRDSAPFASLDAGGGGSAVEQFQLARSLEAEGKTGEARSHYIRARDLDVLRFRADSKLNAITQSLGQAESENVIFIDAQTALDAQSPGGIAGREIFYEHVHFTFEGNYHLARLFSGEIASQLTSGGDKPGGQWLTSAECAERLAYTDWDRGVVLASVIRRLQQPPFNQRLNSDEAIGQLQAQLQRVAKRLDRTAALEAYSTALKARPNDWRLLQRRGLLLSSAGRHEEGVDSLKRALGQTPWSRILHYQLGAMQNKAGQFDDALSSLAGALKLKPDFPEAVQQLTRARAGIQYRLGEKEKAAGNAAGALGHYVKATQLDDGFAEAHFQVGVCRVEVGRIAEATASFERALKLKPDFPEAVQQLTRERAGIQYRLGEKEKAAGNAAGALAHYVKATELDDGFAEAHFQVGVCRVEAGRIAEATASFERAVALKPGLPQARFNLVTGLLRQARYSDALGHLEALASENPNDIQVQQYLQFTRSKLRETAKPQP